MQRPSVSHSIREDEKAANLLLSCTHKDREYYDTSGEQVHLHQEVRKLGYSISLGGRTNAAPGKSATSRTGNQTNSVVVQFFFLLQC
jgi:hypothetical protein